MGTGDCLPPPPRPQTRRRLGGEGARHDNTMGPIQVGRSLQRGNLWPSARITFSTACLGAGTLWSERPATDSILHRHRGPHPSQTKSSPRPGPRMTIPAVHDYLINQGSNKGVQFGSGGLGFLGKVHQLQICFLHRAQKAARLLQSRQSFNPTANGSMPRERGHAKAGPMSALSTAVKKSEDSEWLTLQPPWGVHLAIDFHKPLWEDDFGKGASKIPSLCVLKLFCP